MSRHDELSLDAVSWAIDEIVMNIGTKLRLNCVAASTGFPLYRFHRIFSAMTGETPSEFSSRVRMERALSMLAYSSKSSVTDIAIKCGFGSVSSFSRSFKRVHGMALSRFDLVGLQLERRGDLTGSHHMKVLPEGGRPDRYEVGVRRRWRILDDPDKWSNRHRLFHGMFDSSILTLNPGWSGPGQAATEFTDVRELSAALVASDIDPTDDTTGDTASGPASFHITDPDGNVILIDQHV